MACACVCGGVLPPLPADIMNRLSARRAAPLLAQRPAGEESDLSRAAQTPEKEEKNRAASEQDGRGFNSWPRLSVWRPTGV